MNTAAAIDLCTPIVAARILQLDETGLLDAVNGGRLPAYDLGGAIRFRVADVEELARDLVAA